MGGECSRHFAIPTPPKLSIKTRKGSSDMGVWKTGYTHDVNFIFVEAEAFFKLNSIMKSFCYASDNYAKVSRAIQTLQLPWYRVCSRHICDLQVNCWRHSQSCLKNARLVRLQIQIFSSGVTVVNLDDFSLRKFLANHAQFFQVSTELLHLTWALKRISYFKSALKCSSIK